MVLIFWLLHLHSVIWIDFSIQGIGSRGIVVIVVILSVYH